MVSLVTMKSTGMIFNLYQHKTPDKKKTIHVHVDEQYYLLYFVVVAYVRCGSGLTSGS